MTLLRWQKAQQYERSYWMNNAKKIIAGATGQLRWYEWKFHEMEKRLIPNIDIEWFDMYSILEIGCGPIGIISYINRGQRYGLDPLEEFYRSNEVLRKLRDPRVQYLEGTGEQIPFEYNFFDLVILDNALDHVYDPNLVMSEIIRVLKPGGYLYLVINIRGFWGTQIHKILTKLMIDKGHPQSFDVSSIRRLINRFGFSVASETVSDSREARSKDIHSRSLKDNVKGYTGLSEFLYYALCRKT